LAFWVKISPDLSIFFAQITAGIARSMK
jgi:hypothetical protein